MHHIERDQKQRTGTILKQEATDFWRHGADGISIGFPTTISSEEGWFDSTLYRIVQNQ